MLGNTARHCERVFIMTKNYPAISGQIDTVQSLSREVNALNEGGIRWTIHQNKEKLLDRGAIFYIGRKLLIDREIFISTLKKDL